MYIVNNNKQLTKSSSMRLGNPNKQFLLFSLVHIILCYAKENKVR
jgi:hypothetical protein